LSEFDLVIYKLISKEIGLKEFEQWVYSEKRIQELLATDEYLDLISLNYKTPSSLYDAEKILRKYVDIGKCYEWQLKVVLQKVIDRSSDAHKYIERCYDLYCDGYYFLDNLGLGYGLMAAVPPEKYNAENWKELSARAQQKLMDDCYPAVAEEAKKVIQWIESGKIVLTGHAGGYQGIEYEDNRTAEEKQPTGYKLKTRSRSWWKFW
jgi:hypothetical protein